MDIKQLKFLLALEETRHFGKAAELCNVTQPTLSMRIRGLEEELDLHLILRGQRFEGFTEAGERILAWAKTLLAAHDGLLAEAASCRGQLVGNLRLGMVPLSSFDPMQLVKPLTEQYPELCIQQSAMSSEQIINALHRNQLDLGLCYLDRLDIKDFEIIELGPTRMGLLHHPKYFQFSQSELNWEAVSQVPLGLLSKAMHFRQSIVLNFGKLGLDPHPFLESDSTLQLVQAVSGGICCAIMPLQHEMAPLDNELKMTPIANAQTNAPLALLMRQSEPRSTVAIKCFDVARSIFETKS